jgi:hypothetical protein
LNRIERRGNNWCLMVDVDGRPTATRKHRRTFANYLTPNLKKRVKTR